MTNEDKSTKLVIRPLRLDMIPRFHRLFHEAVELHFSYFPEAERRRVLKNHSRYKILLAIISPKRIILTAHTNGKLTGYAVGNVPDSGSGQLYWLYVDPDQRGNNVGLALLSRMIRMQADKGAHDIYLVTHDHRKYYQRQGFKFVKNVEEAGVKLALMRFKVLG
jgi:N-acetylglutamate synthase-like GNAT family acetyltransferase